MKIFMKRITLLIGMILISSVSGQQVRVDIITSMNDASKIQIENDSLFSATTGGFFIYNLNRNQYQSWTVGDGFYDQRFTAFTRTHRNLLALGTSEGVVSFMNLKNGDISNEVSLQGNNIIDIISVGDTLWILADRSLAVYRYLPEDQRFRFVDFFQNFGSTFSSLTGLHYALHRIWVSSTDGIFHAPSNYVSYNLKSSSNWSHITTAQGLPSNSVNDLSGDESRFFAATSNGLARIDSQGVTQMTTGAITKVRVLDDEIYACNNNTIFQYENGNLQGIYTYPSILIRDFNLDPSGNIWVALEQRGIIEAGTDNEIFIDGPIGNFIGDVHVDSRGWLWCTSGTVLGQSRNGVFLRTSSEWRNYKIFGPGLWSTASQTLNILEDTAGNIWISSWNGGITIFDPDLNITTINRLSTTGNLWRKSITMDDTIEVQTPVDLRDMIAGQLDNQSLLTITDFYLDEATQSIWILDLHANSDNPVVRFKDTKFSNAALDTNNWQDYNNPDNREYSNNLLSMTRDIFGIYWMASDRFGLFRMQIDEQGNKTGWDNINESDNIKSKDVLDVAADEDGYVWIGTRAGLSAYLGGTVFDFREEFQPIGLQINDILIDSQTNKWFATDRGLSVLRNSGSPFDPASWIHVVPRTSDVTRSNVIYADLPSENINSVFLDDKTGDIYLGTSAGIAVIRGNPFTSTFTSFENVRFGPNPFFVSENTTTPLRFYNLMASSEVKILTPNGELVRKLNPNNFNEVQGSQAQWNGLNMEGELVASGVYIYLITTEDGKNESGKFLVIRQ